MKDKRIGVTIRYTQKEIDTLAEAALLDGGRSKNSLVVSTSVEAAQKIIDKSKK